MNERLKKLRKHLDLTQAKFANKIGVKQNTVAQYEMGRNVPIDSVITLICKEYNVNEDWLRYGTGEMFVKKTMEQELIDFTADMLLGGDNFKKRLISALAKLSEDQWDLLESIVDEISNKKE